MDFSNIRSALCACGLVLSAANGFAAGLSGPMGGLEPGGPRERAVLRARAHPKSLLKIDGRFGSFVGRVDSIGAEGFSGFHPHARQGAVPPDPLAWPGVSRAAYRGNAAERGILIGGILGAMVGGATGYSISQSDFGSGSPPGDVTVGAVIGVVVVGAAGGLIGAVIPQWHTIYRAPPGGLVSTRP